MSDTTNPHLPLIVYVEDNAGDAALLEEALREGGHRVQLLVMETGDRALHYFKVKASAKDIPPPHCILLDHYVQVVTGGQLLRFLRACDLYRDTAVYLFAAMSGYRDLIDEGHVSEKSFLTKPIDWDGFVQLSNLLMRSATMSQERRKSDHLRPSPEIPAPEALRRPKAERSG